MATQLSNLSDHDPAMVPSGAGKIFGIVVSEWNSEITSALLKGCLDTLLQYGVSEKDILIRYVPGTFELPVGAQKLAELHRLAGIVCIGCVIKGETKHDEYISHATANGIMQLGLSLHIPVVFGVLTPNNMAQALERAGGKYGNKGIEAAVTVLKMAAF
jgi:6,7-dimethyl-8-ribityllumazine synthase